MTFIQSTDQALPEIIAKQGTSWVEEIDSVHTADGMQNHTMKNVKNTTLTPIASTEKLSQSTIQSGACTFKLEKPKPPVFVWNVRDCAIFRSNFKYATEAKYAKRDAVTLHWTCLRDRPLDLTKGIGSDYDATWEYLDSIDGKRGRCAILWPGTPCQNLLQYSERGQTPQRYGQHPHAFSHRAEDVP